MGNGLVGKVLGGDVAMDGRRGGVVVGGGGGRGAGDVQKSVVTRVVAYDENEAGSLHTFIHDY